MAVPDRCYHCGRRGELEQHAVYDAEIAPTSETAGVSGSRSGEETSTAAEHVGA